MATIHRLTGPLSSRLRQVRIDAGLTQQDISARTGLSLKSVGNYESPRYRGARKPYAVKQWAEECGRTFEEVWPPGKGFSPRGCNGGEVVDLRARRVRPIHRGAAA